MIADEKGAIVAAVRPGGFALLNADDARGADMAQRTSERIVTFGRANAADYRVSSVTASAGGTQLSIDTPMGGLEVETQFVAEHFWLPTVVAIAAASELGVPRETIVARAKTFEGLFTRFQLRRTRNGPTFILDTAKAPRDTLGLAFDALARFDVPVKRIVLGQISDFAGAPRKVYRDAFRAASAIADQVIFVGEHAHRSMASIEDRETGRFVECRTPRQVLDHLRGCAGSEDLILLKGSANLHLERIALAWDQRVACWEPACGIRMDCLRCGLLPHPFSRNRATQWLRRHARLIFRKSVTNRR